jgi:hypothetical protein
MTSNKSICIPNRAGTFSNRLECENEQNTKFTSSTNPIFTAELTNLLNNITILNFIFSNDKETKMNIKIGYEDKNTTEKLSELLFKINVRDDAGKVKSIVDGEYSSYYIILTNDNFTSIIDFCRTIDILKFINKTYNAIMPIIETSVSPSKLLETSVSPSQLLEKTILSKLNDKTRNMHSWLLPVLSELKQLLSNSTFEILYVKKTTTEKSKYRLITLKPDLEQIRDEIAKIYNEEIIILQDDQKFYIDLTLDNLKLLFDIIINIYRSSDFDILFNKIDEVRETEGLPKLKAKKARHTYGVDDPTKFNLAKTGKNDYLFDVRGLHTLSIMNELTIYDASGNILYDASGNILHKNWFKDYFGLEETDLWVNSLSSSKIPSRTLKTICESLDMTVKYYLYNTEKLYIYATNIKFTINNILYNVGDFLCLPLITLKKYQTYELSKDALKNITYNIIKEDIVSLINNKSSPTDVFQAASQFNLLEMAQEDVPPENGISNYYKDNSQGPRVAIASPIGTFFRNYLIYNNYALYETTDIDGYPQTTDKQFNTLQTLLDLPELKFIKVNTNPTQGEYLYKNGYCFINPTQEQSNFAQANQNLFEEHLKVGVQWNSPLLINYNRKLCQVYCSGLPFGSYALKYGLKLDSDGYEDRIKPFAVGILKAAFKCTLQVAVNKLDLLTDDSRINVYLTAVGSGEFKNPMEWVVEALIYALNDFKHYPLDVIMVTYGGVHPLLEPDAINPEINLETTKYKYLKYKHKYLELKNNNL